MVRKKKVRNMLVFKRDRENLKFLDIPGYPKIVVEMLKRKAKLTGCPLPSLFKVGSSILIVLYDFKDILSHKNSLFYGQDGFFYYTMKDKRLQ